MNWFSLTASRNISVVSTATLALLGVIGNRDRLWVWILAIGCALVVVTLEVLRTRRERNTSNRLGRNYEVVLGSVLRLIADLSDLTAREFDLWVVDLYLPIQSFSLSPHARTRRLQRSLSISLTDVRTVPREFSLDHGLVGPCFTERVPRIWWNIDLAPTADDNDWHKINDADNNQLLDRYGAVSVNPVSNNLRTDCRGLLVIHVKVDAEAVTKVLGALRQSEGKRRVTAACREIHSQLGTS